MNKEKDYLKYATGRLYMPEKTTSGFPYLEGDIIRHKNLKVFGKFIGYDKENQTVLAVMQDPNGNEIRDVVQNWEQVEK